MQNIPDEGFEGIHLVVFEKMGDLDVGVLNRMTTESKHLSKLTISGMTDKDLSELNKEKLTVLTKDIIELRPPLTHLDLCSFIKSEI